MTIEAVGFKAYTDALANFAKTQKTMQVAPPSIPTEHESFGATLSNSLGKVNDLQAQKQSMIQSFASGENQNVHELMISLQKAGLRIPGDVSVAGFDDIEFSSIFEPSLTTIRQPQYQMGREAMLKLLKLMNGEPLEASQVILDFELVVRDSCGAVRKNEGKQS